ncbi:hypothetical protein DL96DRAFT_1821786 [Flagelloscypha sp. PMI_526]|nr:hypothetical protein DL96DRAFT_1821786 [Flagelloscypha sp. PMI_526]
MATRESPTFNSADADVTLKSSDGTLFKVHSQHLAWASGAFPPLSSNPDEIVEMSENSEILENLLGFMYPRRHPHLHDIKFETLAGLAEAAEKYEVFSAMNLCNYKMKDFMSKHPAQVLAYACKHDYPHIIEASSEFGLKRPLGEIVSMLPRHLVMPWVMFREQYVNAWSWSCKQYAPAHGSVYGSNCDIWSLLVHPFLAGAIHTTIFPNSGDFIWSAKTSNQCCTRTAQEWRSYLENEYRRAKPFRSFI